MSNGDREGRVYLSHPHKNYRILILLTTKYRIFIGNTCKRLSENTEFAEMRHGDVILRLQRRSESTCGQRGTDVRLFMIKQNRTVVKIH